MSENDTIKLPEVIVFAGPNGSGKSTITRMARTVGEYINADDIKRATLCSDIEAAIKAEELREKMITQKRDFTFKKRKDVYYRWENTYWNNSDIEKLSGITEYNQ